MLFKVAISDIVVSNSFAILVKVSPRFIIYKTLPHSFPKFVLLEIISFSPG